MSNTVMFGKVPGVVSAITGHRAKNYETVTFNGIGTFSGIAGQPWAEIQPYMLNWAKSRVPVEPAGLGFRMLLDFSGTLSPNPAAILHMLDANPSSFADYSLKSESFVTHDPGNILFKFATGQVPRPVHSSSNQDFFVMTNKKGPMQVIHSFIIARGLYTCASALPSDQWQSLGGVIDKEVELLGRLTAINEWGFRLEMNNGYYAQAIPQMHAHIRAGNMASEPIT